jgi:hypothetical protein
MDHWIDLSSRAAPVEIFGSPREERTRAAFLPAAILRTLDSSAFDPPRTICSFRPSLHFCDPMLDKNPIALMTF